MLLAWQTFRRRMSPDARLAFYFLLSMAIWSLAYAGELGSASLAQKLLWTKVQYIGIALAPALFLRFATEYTALAGGSSSPRTRRPLWRLVWVIPVLTLLLEWTDEFHHLVHSSARLVSLNGMVHADFSYGPWFWVHVVYSYTALLLATGMLLHSAWRGSRETRTQVNIILFGAAVPYLANLVYLIDLPIFSHLDLTPIAFTISGICMYIGIARFRLFDLLPLARGVVLESMLDGVIILDDEQRILDINPAARKALGWDSGLRAISSQPLSQLWPNWVKLRQETREGESFEYHRSLPGGIERDYEVQVLALQEPGGPRLGSLVVLHDISERKQYATQQEQLNRTLARALDVAQQASQAKSTFLSNISDELRTPLNAIIGLAQFIAQNQSTDSELRTNAEIIELNGTRLLQMVDRVLEMVRLESGGAAPDRTPFDLSSLLFELEDRYSLQAIERGIAFQIERRSGLPAQLNSDREKVVSILAILLDNALQFTAYGGQVQLRAWVETAPTAGDAPRTLFFSVQDTGHGLSPGQLETLFEPFTGRSQAYGGVSLSLPLARQLARLLGGDLSATSRAGQGSLFTLKLPCP